MFNFGLWVYNPCSGTFFAWLALLVGVIRYYYSLFTFSFFDIVGSLSFYVCSMYSGLSLISSSSVCFLLMFCKVSRSCCYCADSPFSFWPFSTTNYLKLPFKKSSLDFRLWTMGWSKSVGWYLEICKSLLSISSCVYGFSPNIKFSFVKFENSVFGSYAWPADPIDCVVKLFLKWCVLSEISLFFKTNSETFI